MRIKPELKREIRELLGNKNLRIALSRVISRYRETREKALSNLGDFKEIRKRLMDIKDSAIESMDLLWERVGERLSENKAIFLELKDEREARDKILEILKEARVDLLIKGKSITSEEIGINGLLEKNGIKVIETDLGERILQLFGDKPSHLIVPAIHRTKEEIAELFSRYYKEEIPPDPYIITKRVRSEFRNYFLNAKAGLTGINVVSADPTYFYLMTNEGNGRLVATMPDLYITLVGLEKAVGSLGDAMFILRVLPRSAVGLNFSSYVSMFSAPFDWNGRRRWYVLVLDNGRKRAREDRYLRHGLRCIRCGACMMVCPVYRVLSGQGFSKIYMGGIGVIWTAINRGLDEALELAELCTSCGSCSEVCPAGIPISDVIEDLRSRKEPNNLLERYAPIVIGERKKYGGIMESVRTVKFRSGEPFLSFAYRKGLLDKDADTAFYGGCLVEEFFTREAMDTVDLLEDLGVDLGVVGGICCGLPLKIYGKKGDYIRNGLILKEKLEKYKTVITICDSCYSTLYEIGFRNVTSLYEYLSGINTIFYAYEPYRVVLHIPCHTRIVGKDRDFVKFMESIMNVELIRSEYESVCCGGAGLYRFKFPTISHEIFRLREEFIRDVKPDFIITTCPSCILQFKEEVKRLKLNVDIVHLATFLKNFTRYQ